MKLRSGRGGGGGGKDIKHRAWSMKGISVNLEGTLGSQGIELAPLGTWSEQDKRELKVVDNTLSSSQIFPKQMSQDYLPLPT